MLGKIIVFLIEIGFGLNFTLVGTISLSEIILLVTPFFYIRKSYFTKYPELKKITRLYLFLLLVQIASEILVGNTFTNAAKGFAVTIVSYLHFMFLFRYFIKDRSIITYAIIGIIVRILLFGSQFEVSLKEASTAEAATILKFYIAPIVTNVLLLISLHTPKKLAATLFFVTGAVIVALGARSAGAMVLATGIFAYFLLKKRTQIRIRTVIQVSLLALFVGYGLYGLYVNQVLKGKITSGNSWQITRMQQPYNPINLLLMGRTETFVGAVAFFDKFWTGHGAWAEDKTGKYSILLFDFKDMNYREQEQNIIPAHSVLVGAGMQNGIVAFLLMLVLFLLFVKTGIRGINTDDRYLFLLLFFLIQVVWTVLFSPTSHFRSSLPFYFAFILSSFIVSNKQGV